MKYLVAYDIGHPRRLRRVARHMERHALRCQKSVFLFEGTQAQLAEILSTLQPMLRAEEDSVQAWKLAPAETETGQYCGTPGCIMPSSVVLYPFGERLINQKQKAVERKQLLSSPPCQED